MANAYDRAIDILHERGHHKGSLSNQGREVCAVGALRIAIFGCLHPGIGRETKSFLEFSAHLRFMKDVLNVPEIAHWNDSPKTTTDDVIFGFKKTSEAYELRQE
jgi:hypothetical protein